MVHYIDTFILYIFDIYYNLNISKVFMLQKLGFLPGFNKQVTSTGAESQWTDGEKLYVLDTAHLKKIGGWSQLGSSKLTGVDKRFTSFCN